MLILLTRLGIRGYVKIFRQGVYGLGADTVQTYGFLEGLVVEFSAGVQVARRLDDRVERDSAPEVPYGDRLSFDADDYVLSETGREFIYGIVYDFFQQHIYAVARVGASAEVPDVHPGPFPDVLVPFKGLDVFVSVFGCIGNQFCHKGNYRNKRIIMQN